VAELRRYPVKSMGPEAVTETDVSWFGLVGDRRWAFLRDGTTRNGFPWLTLRQRPDLNHYRPTFLEPDRPDRSRTVVSTPSGAEFDVTDPLLAAELGPGVRILKQDRGCFDGFALSLITRQSVAGISALTGSVLDVLRFRPNLLIDDTTELQYPEDGWVGRTLQIGTVLVRVDMRDRRCLIAATDPATGVRDSSILRTIFTERDGGLGVYGSIVRPGRIRVGDDVRLLATLELPEGQSSAR